MISFAAYKPRYGQDPTSSGGSGSDVGFPSVCCEYVLLPLANKKLLQSMAGQNIARLEEIYRESRQSQGDTMLLLKVTDT